MPAAAFREVGLLDERFFMYYEETDWLRQARDRGYRLLYRPEAVIYHRESASSGPPGGWMTPFKHYYATRNRLYLMRKNSSSRGAYALFTAYFLAGRLAYLALYLVRRRPRLARALVRGVLDYYRGRMGRTAGGGRPVSREPTSHRLAQIDTDSWARSTCFAGLDNLCFICVNLWRID